MKKLLGTALGMLGMIILVESGLAFFGMAHVVNGLQAGLSLLAFSATLFIAGVFMVKPKDDSNE
jgi:hypothetical protein